MSEKEKVIIPTIHLNGSSKNYLKELNYAAYRAVNDALNECIKAAPHARDYYVQSEGSYEQARLQHRAQLEKLTSVCNYFQSIWIGIEDQ